MAIAKSNKLIETSYTLGSREQFFILYLISQISQNDTEFREYRISYKDISQLMNFDGRRRVANKEDIFKMMNNLNTQPIRFTQGEEDVQLVWITSLRHNKRTGEYIFTFGKELKPFLLQLKEHFTLFNIDSVVHLSGHSTRIYEVLKRHQFKKEPVTLTIADLKFWSIYWIFGHNKKAPFSIHGSTLRGHSPLNILIIPLTSSRDTFRTRTANEPGASFARAT